jgi:Na+/H+-dicarboxylate symporter
MKLPTAIALGLVAGLLLGLVASITGSSLLLKVATGIEPVGEAFVNLLKMVVIPLVTSMIFVGVGTMGDLRKLGRLGAGALLFFAATTVVSVLLGMGIMKAFLPLASDAVTEAVGSVTTDAPMLPGPIGFLLSLIPANPFAAAAEGALLPLIVFTIFLAAATSALPATERDRLLSLASALAAALIKLVHWILFIAPLGVFALAAPVTARAGWAMLQSLGAFILAVLLGLVVFVAGVYLPAVILLARRQPWSFLRACTSPIVIALSSAVSRPVASFVVPLGSAICRAGSALFQGAAIVFLAWFYGVPLEIAGVGGAVLATFIVSFTVAGIPTGGVLSLAPALGGVGIPLDGLGVLLGVDRIPDMARTTTNVIGVLTATVVIDRLTGDRP